MAPQMIPDSVSLSTIAALVCFALVLLIAWALYRASDTPDRWLIDDSPAVSVSPAELRQAAFHAARQELKERRILRAVRGGRA